MPLGILIEETALLKRLDKPVAESVDNKKLEEALTVAQEYKEALWHMPTHVHIGLASQLRNTGRRSSSTRVDTACVAIKNLHIIVH